MKRRSNEMNHKHNKFCKIIEVKNRIVAMMFYRTNRRMLYILSCIVIIIIILYRNMNELLDITDRETTLAKIDQYIKTLENSSACKLPNLPVNAPEMMKFVKNEPLVDCSSAEPNWVVVDGSECIISEEAKRKYGSINCTFLDLIRINDYHSKESSFKVLTDKSYTLRESDVVKVHCKSSKKEWQSILTGIRLNQSILDRTGWDKLPSNSMKLNVLMFGFDSLSRNTFIRKLPKSYKYLIEELNLQVLKGYNIVGDGTPQALIPILTGQTELELPDTRKRITGSNPVDVYPFVWKEFSKYGYVTGYLEDMPNVGTFTYRLNGFKNLPTDHYMRQYYLASSPFWSKSPNLCYGSLPRHKIMMNYVKDFFKVYKNKPKFMFGFHGELSHDSYNLIGVADDDLLEFIKDLKNSGHLDNTLLIMMADHGHRFADIRNTLQGKQEERLPFFSFAFPKSFKDDHPVAYNNFIENKETLVTPFDIYSTLSSVLHLDNVGVANLSERSLSLFTKIPKERSCAHAFIEPHWCTCLNWIPLTAESYNPIKEQLAQTLVGTLNNFTNDYRHLCAVLSLKKLHWAHQLAPNDNLLRFKKNKDMDGFVADLSADMKLNSNLYQIKVELVPGDSLFEASITHYIKENKFVMKLSDVSRINLYGKQAHCIENDFPQLRKYCYCKEEI